MEPDRTRRADELVAQALAMRPERWAEFLATECPDDARLRQTVAQRLALDDPATLPTSSATSTAATPPAGVAPRAVIGPYRLKSVLGEGGFGVVWLAERTEPFAQRVALKIIKPGMDSATVIARFEQERRALAVMDHPNVARILDGGITPPEMGARPYFVMEHICGAPITAYCDVHRLSILDRLRLFVPVCEAVQHAHSKGIIHRDLKPGNILVTVQGEHPVPKVIDFGIAKAIASPLTDRTLLTAEGQFIGTPQYMSPEQAGLADAEVDTRTDVYSLGVVLYELLVGVTPFDPAALRAAGLLEVLRMVRDEDPPTPLVRLKSLADEASRSALSRATTPEELRRALRGEVSLLPAKAMHKDPARRYRTPLELAEDIERYMGGKPLRAAPDSAAYVWGKRLARHRLLFAALLMATGAMAFVATSDAAFYATPPLALKVPVAAACAAALWCTALAFLLLLAGPAARVAPAWGRLAAGAAIIAAPALAFEAAILPRVRAMDLETDVQELAAIAARGWPVVLVGVVFQAVVGRFAARCTWRRAVLGVFVYQAILWGVSLIGAILVDISRWSDR